MARNDRNQMPHGVLFLDNSLYIGGLERKLLDFFRAIDRTRFRPVLACLKEGGTLAGDVREADVKVYEHLAGFRYDPVPILRIARIIRKENIRIIYTFAHRNTLFYSFVLRRYLGGPPVVVSIHATRSWDKGHLLGRAQRYFLSAADRVLALAPLHRDYLVEEEGVPPGKIEIIHNGVDLELYRPGRDGKKFRREVGLRDGIPVITIVARLVAFKGHRVLLEALELIKTRTHDFRALIVGDGPEREELKAEAVRRGLAQEVVFTGPRSDIPDVLASSDLVVLPSFQVETLPNALLEAMASGLPVVATPVGSVPDVVVEGETGFLVPSGDASALADRITLLLLDRSRAETMGRMGRKRAETVFPLERMFRRREKVFSELLRSSPATRISEDIPSRSA